MPIVGAVVGTLGALLFGALRFWEVSHALRAVVMIFFYPAVTGGLHMDGFMDACDTIFSRKGREERLEILSDTHVGAFAVMGCAAVFMLKFGIFSELFTSFHSGSLCGPYTILLALIPVYSRFGLSLLFFMPFAKEDGLARTLGAARVYKDRLFILTGYALFGTAVLPLGLKWLFVPLTSGVTLVLYGRYCVKNFGGITGDLMGAYVELSEVLMLLAFAIMKGQAGPCIS
jgi:adenosylcobinamide-GDP ribazoletransferase